MSTHFPDERVFSQVIARSEATKQSPHFYLLRTVRLPLGCEPFDELRAEWLRSTRNDVEENFLDLVGILPRVSRG